MAKKQSIQNNNENKDQGTSETPITINDDSIFIDDVSSTIETISLHPEKIHEMDDTRNAELQINADPKPSSKEVECQTNKQERDTLLSWIKTDAELKTWTGLPSFQTLEILVKIVLHIERKSNIKFSLDVEDRIILTMIVIKQSLQYNMLATLFNRSSTTISKYFNSTLCSLSEGLHSAIYWPNNEENKQSMPIYFKSLFEDTKIVLDCTECKMAALQCLECRMATYSLYKGAHTVKYLIGVAPSGAIIYVSRGYPGRASDKYIFNKENVIDLINPATDAVMTDKGFAIDKELSERGIFFYF
jgi:hypothetical protein